MNTTEIAKAKLTGNYVFRRHWLLRSLIVLYVEEQVQYITDDSQISKPHEVWRKGTHKDVVELFDNPIYYKDKENES